MTENRRNSRFPVKKKHVRISATSTVEKVTPPPPLKKGERTMACRLPRGRTRYYFFLGVSAYAEKGIFVHVVSQQSSASCGVRRDDAAETTGPRRKNKINSRMTFFFCGRFSRSTRPNRLSNFFFYFSFSGLVFI